MTRHSKVTIGRKAPCAFGTWDSVIAGYTWTCDRCETTFSAGDNHSLHMRANAHINDESQSAA